MRPKFFPTLVNDRFGDPAVYVDFLLERRAILFDLGDIHALPPRSLLRLTDVFVSHAHIDHFVGFDHLLRLLVGREKRLRLYGPPGFIERVAAKLAGYTWNLADRFSTELTFIAMEIGGDRHAQEARFRLSNRFAREVGEGRSVADGVILREPSLRVTFAQLEHRTPCLAFALQETEHVNIWKNKLEELGLSVGPWLAKLKAAIFEGLADDTPIAVRRGASREDTLPLGMLRRAVVSVTAGQKIAYVTDAAHSPENRRAIVALADGADMLFIEAAFAKADTALAAERAHLTTAQAGRLARQAQVARLEPFHFSPRYAKEEARLLAEVEEAFGGPAGLDSRIPTP